MTHTHNQLLAIKRVVADWAKAQADIHGLALVGSHARNAARADSDVDLLLLVTDPTNYRDGVWVSAINWALAGLHLKSWSDEEYGAVWSRRVWFEPNTEIEFAFAKLSWADVSLVNPGTREVVAGGCQILYDPDGLLERLAALVTPG